MPFLEEVGSQAGGALVASTGETKTSAEALKERLVQGVLYHANLTPTGTAGSEIVWRWSPNVGILPPGAAVSINVTGGPSEQRTVAPQYTLEVDI
ncbi:unnamed protein product, partial [Chrysoparadoxa australica]